MAYWIGRSLVALLAAYLLAGIACVVIQEIRDDWRPITERLFVDGWREVQCYFSGKLTCCGWGYRYNCPLFKTLGSACFAFAFSIVPVAIMMLVVRRFNWDRPLSEILLGGVLGLMAAVLTAQIPYSDDGPDFHDIYPRLKLLPYIIPGMIGGFTYWRVAGRPRPKIS